jgi:membrane protein DedA with SNARE-associated domain
MTLFFVDSLDVYLQTYGILAVGVFMYSNGIISTPPSEATLAFGGILAAAGHHSLLTVTAIAVLSNLAGALTLYSIGATVGTSWLTGFRGWLIRKHMPLTFVNWFVPPQEVIDELKNTLANRGKIWIAVFRCLPMVRSIVSLPAGMTRMPLLSFISFSTIGMTVWAMLWEGAGYWLGSKWKAFGSRLHVVLYLMLALLVLEVLRRAVKRYIW